MRNLFILSLLASFSVVGCSNRQDARDASRDTAQESRDTAGEARGVGREPARDIDATDAAGDNAAGRVPDTAKNRESFVGTVTGFTAGKTLSVQTADGDSKTFDLKEKGTKVDVPKNIKKGSKVQVTVDRTGDQKTIKVASQK